MSSDLESVLLEVLSGNAVFPSSALREDATHIKDPYLASSFIHALGKQDESEYFRRAHSRMNLFRGLVESRPAAEYVGYFDLDEENDFGVGGVCGVGPVELILYGHNSDRRMPVFLITSRKWVEFSSSSPNWSIMPSRKYRTLAKQHIGTRGGAVPARCALTDSSFGYLVGSPDTLSAWTVELEGALPARFKPIAKQMYACIVPAQSALAEPGSEA